MKGLIHDPEAEETIAAVAAWSVTGAAIVKERGFTVEHFHDSRCGWVVRVAPLVDPGLGWEDRPLAVARAAGVDELWLDDIMGHSPVLWDLAGAVARRVFAAYELRQRAIAMLDELQELTGKHVHLEDVA